MSLQTGPPSLDPAGGSSASDPTFPTRQPFRPGVHTDMISSAPAFLPLPRRDSNPAECTLRLADLAARDGGKLRVLLIKTDEVGNREESPVVDAILRGKPEQVELSVLNQPATEDIDAKMRRFKPHCVHFIAYNTEAGLHWIDGNQLQIRPHRPPEVAAFFQGQPQCALAVFSGSNTAPFAAAVCEQADVSFAIGSSQLLDSQATLGFSRKFWDSALDLSVSEALTAAGVSGSCYHLFKAASSPDEQIVQRWRLLRGLPSSGRRHLPGLSGTQLLQLVHFLHHNGWVVSFEKRIATTDYSTITFAPTQAFPDTLEAMLAVPMLRVVRRGAGELSGDLVDFLPLTGEDWKEARVPVQHRKVSLLGEPDAGKTTLLALLRGDHQLNGITSTVAVDYCCVQLLLSEDRKRVDVRGGLADPTAGFLDPELPSDALGQQPAAQPTPARAAAEGSSGVPASPPTRQAAAAAPAVPGNTSAPIQAHHSTATATHDEPPLPPPAAPPTWPGAAGDRDHFLAHVFDFAGQHIYLASHGRFITPSQLTIVVFSLAGIEGAGWEHRLHAKVDNVCSWLHMVRRLAGQDPTFLVVGTHVGACSSPKAALKLMWRACHEIHEHLGLSPLEFFMSEANIWFQWPRAGMTAVTTVDLFQDLDFSTPEPPAHIELDTDGPYRWSALLYGALNRTRHLLPDIAASWVALLSALCEGGATTGDSTPTPRRRELYSFAEVEKVAAVQGVRDADLDQALDTLEALGLLLRLPKARDAPRTGFVAVGYAGLAGFLKRVLVYNPAADPDATLDDTARQQQAFSQLAIAPRSNPSLINPVSDRKWLEELRRQHLPDVPTNDGLIDILLGMELIVPTAKQGYIVVPIRPRPGDWEKRCAPFRQRGAAAHLLKITFADKDCFLLKTIFPSLVARLLETVELQRLDPTDVWSHGVLFPGLSGALVLLECSDGVIHAWALPSESHPAAPDHVAAAVKRVASLVVPLAHGAELSFEVKQPDDRFFSLMSPADLQQRGGGGGAVPTGNPALVYADFCEEVHGVPGAECSLVAAACSKHVKHLYAARVEVDGPGVALVKAMELAEEMTADNHAALAQFTDTLERRVGPRAACVKKGRELLALLAASTDTCFADV